jgi:HKD family nuclease
VSAVEFLIGPHGRTVGKELSREFNHGRWKVFRAAVAFAKMSGVGYLDAPLRSFLASGGRCTISVGIDHGGTSFEALSQLLGAVGRRGKIYVVHELGNDAPTYHPKLYLFTDCGDPPSAARVIVGSANMTRGGLYTNHEASLAWELAPAQDVAAYTALKEMSKELDRWSSLENGLCIPLNRKTLRELHSDGRLPTEKQMSALRTAISTARTKGRKGGNSLHALKRQRRPKAPPVGAIGEPAVSLPPLAGGGEGPGKASSQRAPIPGAGRTRSEVGESRGAPEPGTGGGRPAAAHHRALVIDIVQGDKTECYLAKRPVDEDPGFFGWDWLFTERTVPKTARGATQPQRTALVDIVWPNPAGGPPYRQNSFDLKIVNHVNAHTGRPRGSQDMRMHVPAVVLNALKALPEDCLLTMRRQPRRSIDYELEFLAPTSPGWSAARAVASTRLPGSPRRYGWVV